MRESHAIDRRPDVAEPICTSVSPLPKSIGPGVAPVVMAMRIAAITANGERNENTLEIFVNEVSAALPPCLCITRADATVDREAPVASAP